jgi:hypothetical protein
LENLCVIACKVLDGLVDRLSACLDRLPGSRYSDDVCYWILLQAEAGAIGCYVADPTCPEGKKVDSQHDDKRGQCI